MALQTINPTINVNINLIIAEQSVIMVANGRGYATLGISKLLSFQHAQNYKKRCTFDLTT
jgi:hypothetical protein